MQAAENAMSWSAAMRTLPKYLLTLTQFTKSLDFRSMQAEESALSWTAPMGTVAKTGTHHISRCKAVQFFFNFELLLGRYFVAERLSIAISRRNTDPNTYQKFRRLVETVG